MIYAIVSDIHANLQAWNAVLSDIDRVGADAIICLGDIIGYGPRPAAVLESVGSRADLILLGNHEAALAGRFDPNAFTDDARRIIEGEFGVKYSLPGVYVLLHRLGLSSLVPRPRHKKNDPEKMRQWLEEAPLLSKGSKKKGRPRR